MAGGMQQRMPGGGNPGMQRMQMQQQMGQMNPSGMPQQVRLLTKHFSDSVGMGSKGSWKPISFGNIGLKFTLFSVQNK